MSHGDNAPNSAFSVSKQGSEDTKPVLGMHFDKFARPMSLLRHRSSMANLHASERMDASTSNAQLKRKLSLLAGSKPGMQVQNSIIQGLGGVPFLNGLSSLGSGEIPAGMLGSSPQAGPFVPRSP